MPYLRHIGSNLTARSKHQASGLGLLEKGNIQDSSKKWKEERKKEENAVMS
jgi:hypothetical protein